MSPHSMNSMTGEAGSVAELGGAEILRRWRTNSMGNNVGPDEVDRVMLGQDNCAREILSTAGKRGEAACSVFSADFGEGCRLAIAMGAVGQCQAHEQVFGRDTRAGCNHERIWNRDVNGPDLDSAYGQRVGRHELLGKEIVQQCQEAEAA